MKLGSYENWLFVAVFLIISGIAIAEVFLPFGIVGTVAYLLVIFYFLFFPNKKYHLIAISVVTTGFLIAGYLFVNESTVITDAMVINRFLAIASVWLGLFFTIRYKKFLHDQLQQKKHLNAVFENATEGMLISNVKGEIIAINRFAEIMFGYAHGELLGSKIEKLIPGRFATNHKKHRDNFMSNPHTRPMGAGRDLFAAHKDGHEFPVEISLSHFKTDSELLVVAFVVDITERKKASENIQKLNEELESRVHDRTNELALTLETLESTNKDLKNQISERKIIEEKLLSSQRLYKAIAHNFPDGIIGVLNKEFRYILVDGKELHSLGITNQSLLGKKLFEQMAPVSSSDFETYLQAAFEGEPTSFEIDIKGKMYNVVAVPLPDLRDEINEILIVMQNITNQKAMEGGLRHALEKERELGELKSRFVTMASHEFRTPLSTVLSSVFLLENYSGDTYEKQKSLHINRIKKAVNNLTEILNDFLSIGKLEEGRVEVSHAPFNLDEFIGDLIQELESVKKPDQVFAYKHEGDGKVVFSDQQLLKNILINLCSNAIKYSNPGDTISITSSLNHELFEIKVEDQGIGIPEEEQARIFNRFYRAQNATNIQGTGLGLNIVSKYVELLNGTIEFKSKENRGTIFKVKLPILNQ